MKLGNLASGLVAGVLAIAACDERSDSNVAAGSTGGDCLADGTCNGDLYCLDGTCVDGAHLPWPEEDEHNGGGGPLVLPENECVTLPLADYRVTGYTFGETVGGLAHLGEDIHAPAGEPVYAVAAGELIYARNHPPRNGGGNWGGLALQTATVGGTTRTIVYGHLDPDALPLVGTVERGEQIGVIATREQTGFTPHLHIQMAHEELEASVVAGYASSADDWEGFTAWIESVAADPSCAPPDRIEDCEPANLGASCLLMGETGTYEADRASCNVPVAETCTVSPGTGALDVDCAEGHESTIPTCSILQLDDGGAVVGGRRMTLRWDFMFSPSELAMLTAVGDATIEWQLANALQDDSGPILAYTRSETNLPGATVRDSRCDVLGCDSVTNALVTLCPQDIKAYKPYFIEFEVVVRADYANAPADEQSIVLDVIASQYCDQLQLDWGCGCEAPSNEDGVMSATASWNCREDKQRYGRVLELDSAPGEAEDQRNTLVGLLWRSAHETGLAVTRTFGPGMANHRNTYFANYDGGLVAQCGYESPGTGGTGGVGGSNAGGVAPTGGAGDTGGTGGTGESGGTGGAASEPVVTGVLPSSGTVGTPLTFTVSGFDLPNTTQLFVPDCTEVGSTSTSGTSTSRSLTCTPLASGVVTAQVFDNVGGEELGGYSVEFSDPGSTCECSSGACCDGCNFRPSTEVCEVDADQQYGCPWGASCGDDVGTAFRDRYCSGSGTSCSGVYGSWKSWQVAEACDSSYACSTSSSSCSYQASCNCECSSGACCDGCNYRSAGHVCQTDADSEYACPYGTDPGDDVAVRYRDQTCSGTSSSCTGAYNVWKSWTIADNCSTSEVCSPGDSTCNVDPSCSATSYWTPTSDDESDSTGVQWNQTINVPVSMQVRQNDTQLEFRVCKASGTFVEDVYAEIRDGADGTGYRTITQLPTAGSQCSDWLGLLSDTGYTETEQFGGIWRVISPYSSAGEWSGGYCSTSGDPSGTCWNGTSITLTRTCLL